MPSRAPHSKSRHGCTLCKAKRVKCDESRPSCSRCVRYSSECQYQINEPQPAALSIRRSSFLGRRDASAIHTQLLTGFFPAPLTDIASQPKHSSSEEHFSTKDLELIFHYTISTCFSLASSTLEDELWCFTVPREAFLNPCLLHGLLSISSLHVAQLRPHETDFYTNLGAQHYSSAMSLSKSLLQSRDSRKRYSVVSFILLIAFISVAMQEAEHATSDYLEVIFSRFRSLRTMKNYVSNIWPTLKTSPVGLFSVKNRGERADSMAINDEPVLEALKGRIHAEIEPELLRGEYLDAVQFLQVFSRQKVFLFTWPLLISDGLFQAMIDREPAAITILGCYGASLQTLASFWWVGVKGSRIVAAASLNVPPEWNAIIGWADIGLNLQQDIIYENVNT